MKNLILLVIPFIVYASGKSLTPQEHMSIHITNHSPSQKFMKKRNMHLLHTITQERVEKIVKKTTGENSQFVRLMHIKEYLIYRVTTKRYQIDINALDGSLINRVKKDT